MKKWYINGYYGSRENLETVDEADTKQDASFKLREYQYSFGPEWTLYLSSRPCKNWVQEQ